MKSAWKVSGRKGNTAVSVVITPEVMLMVRGHATGSGVELIAQGAIATPDGALQADSVGDTGHLARALRHLWRHSEVRERAVVVVLPDTHCPMRPLRLPEVPRQERRAIVRGELEHAGALPIGGGGFDCLWLPGTGKGERNEVIAYYASDALIDGLRHALQRAGLQLAGVEPLSLALMRASLQGRDADQNMALLHMADHHADLCLCRGMQLVHLRRIPVGYAGLATTTRQGRATVAAPQAIYGGRPGLRLIVDDTEPGEEREASEGADGVDQKAFLVAEVTRSLAFYAREFGEEARPGALFLLGEAPVVNALEQILAPVQSLPVLRADIQALPATAGAVQETPRNVDPSLYTAAAGALLGRAYPEGGIPPLNIAQQEAQARARHRAPAFLRGGVALAALWILLATGIRISLSFLEPGVAAENQRLSERIATVQKEQAPSMRYWQTLDQTRNLSARAEIPATAILGRVAAASTGGISLEQLQIRSDGEILLEGSARDIVGVQRFVLALGQGAVVQKPIVQTMLQDIQGRLRFQIAAKYPAPEPASGTENTATKEE